MAGRWLLKIEVKQNRLRAPGRVVLSNLEFAPSYGALDTFLGIPRAAVVSFLKNTDNQIAVDFTVEGDLNNPRFTIHEALATRLASSLAENLGVSIRGVAEGVGAWGRKAWRRWGRPPRAWAAPCSSSSGGRRENSRRRPRPPLEFVPSS